jgi:uncharacterized protein (DUF952 family)
VETIHHIALKDEWDDAVGAGEYRRSTRGLSLEEVGFIHCSTAAQVAGTLERFYGDEPSALVLLTIGVDLLAAEVRHEAVGDERFPHVYGPIEVAAVVEVQPLERDASGAFVLPAGIG